MGAPLAGNIWKVEVQPGQEVEEGDLLFILEAMKMENEVFAERSGVIAEVLVKEGDAVNAEQPLLTFVGEAGTAGAAPERIAAAPAAAENGIAAPLTGNVWKIEVVPGQKVQEGDLLLILEAMKMENEVCADKDGTIGEIYIQEGNSVEIGQVLLTLV
jgi:oxaloacetate decarboxylase alpha subunit